MTGMYIYMYAYALQSYVHILTVPIMHDNIIVVLTSFAVLLIVLILASPAQWRVRNTGTLLNIGWLLAGNLVFLINAIIWRDNVANSVPVWCDICKPLAISPRQRTDSI